MTAEPVEWPTMEAFWLDDIRRWRSMESDYGVHWHDGLRRWPTWRVSHLQDTGELIAVCQRSGLGPVRLIAVVPSDPVEPGEAWYRTLEAILDGYADPAVTNHDLAWFARRLAARGVEVLTDAW